MSRCFPFPPPGYEKKARSDDVDALTKEKHKEKKHKKEKKDKEKREGKDKRDKERSKDKHKEKKDRKERHKDKKKEKDKNKIPDEKKHEGRPESHDDAKAAAISHHTNELKDLKFTEELGHRIKNEAIGTGKPIENTVGAEHRRLLGIVRTMEKGNEKKAEAKEKDKVKEGDDWRKDGQREGRDERKTAGNQAFQKISVTDQMSQIITTRRIGEIGRSTEKDRNQISQNIATHRRIEGIDRPKEKEGYQVSQNITGSIQQKIEGINRPKEKEGNQISQNNITGTVQRRTEGPGRPTEKTGNQILQNIIGEEQRKIDGASRSTEKNGNQAFQNVIGTDQRRIEKMGRQTEKDGNQIFQNIICGDQKRNEGMGKQTEKDIEKKIEKKDKHKDKEGNEKKGEKRKKRDREEKRSKGKDREQEKEKEKENEKTELCGHKHAQNKIKEIEKGQIETGPASYLPPKDGEKSLVAVENLKKRKESEMNGFIHENELRTNKLARPASSSLLPLENGRKTESSHLVVLGAPDRLRETDSAKLESDKEQQQLQKQQQQHHKVNGTIEAEPSKPILNSSTFMEDVENHEAHTGPPHPDLKYLGQILVIPKMEEWSDFDDQEWLFRSEILDSKTKVATSHMLDETPQVWAEALRIDPVDVCALPYVIPY